ncbi:MAG: hypothetical protein AAGC95_15750 [Pseudomonadota bacterium]
MLQRIAVPAGLAGVLALGPLYTYETEDPIRQTSVTTTTTAFQEISPTIDCVMQNGFAAAMQCTPDTPLGALFVGGFAGALIVAVLGLLGVVPGVKKLGALFGLLTGGAAGAGVGWIGYNVMSGSDAANNAVLGWGAYGAGGIAVLMVLMGLLGMRSDD